MNPMNFDETMDACAALPAVELGYPFGPETPVFKVVGKVFAVLGDEGRWAPGGRITLKADPEDAKALVATFDEIIPGYHMNKKHWISVDLPAVDAPLADLIRDSYDLVVARLPRAQRPTP